MTRKRKDHMAKAGELDWSELYKTKKIEQEPISKSLSADVKKDYHKTGKKPTSKDLKKDAEFIVKGWVDTTQGQWKNYQHYDTVIEGEYADLDDRNWNQDPDSVFKQMKDAKVTGDTAIEWNGRGPLTEDMTEEELAAWRMYTKE